MTLLPPQSLERRRNTSINPPRPIFQSLAVDPDGLADIRLFEGLELGCGPQRNSTQDRTTPNSTTQPPPHARSCRTLQSQIPNASRSPKPYNLLKGQRSPTIEYTLENLYTYIHIYIYIRVYRHIYIYNYRYRHRYISIDINL